MDSENECLVFYQWAARGSAELVPFEMRLGCSRLIEEIVRVQGAVAQKFEKRGVKNVAAGLCNDRNLASRPLAKFSAISVGENVEFAHCFNTQQLPANAARRYVRSGDAGVLDSIKRKKIKIFAVSRNDKVIALSSAGTRRGTVGGGICGARVKRDERVETATVQR